MYENYDSRAQLLFGSLNLLFGGILVTVAVVFLSSLKMHAHDEKKNLFPVKEKFFLYTLSCASATEGGVWKFGEHSRSKGRCWLCLR